MKELSIEEKAKRYDEAIEKANSLWHYKNQPCVIDISEIFPELKSEDDNMWKLIKKYIHYNVSDLALEADHITREHLESWLEKQSKQKSIDNVELKETKDESIRKWFIDYFQDCKSEGIKEFDVGVKVDDILEWLKKQGDNRDIHLLELKAKAYDDAKERMSHAYNQNRVPIGFISEIFPNLDSYKNQNNKNKLIKL